MRRDKSLVALLGRPEAHPWPAVNLNGIFVVVLDQRLDRVVGMAERACGGYGQRWGNQTEALPFARASGMQNKEREGHRECRLLKPTQDPCAQRLPLQTGHNPCCNLNVAVLAARSV